MKYLNNGFNANTILLIIEKLELAICKSLRKMLSGKIIHQTRVKYIGVKQNRATLLLLKSINFVNMKNLRNIYFAIPPI